MEKRRNSFKPSTTALKRCLTALSLVFIFPIFGQTESSVADLRAYTHPAIFGLDTSIPSKYPFIDLSQNNFKFYSEEAPNWMHFFREFDAMVSEKDRKLNFYHLGGSHLQADIYTQVFRSSLQSYWEEVCGERGQVFPFSLAGTNNPSNYKFRSPNKWKGYRSISVRPEKLAYGLSGIVATCPDSVIRLNFSYDRTDVRPEFNAFRILHNEGIAPYSIYLLNENVGIQEVITNEEYGYTEFVLNAEIDSLSLEFVKKAGFSSASLEIYGVTLMNNEPGASYSAIGVNGAALSTYLGNSRFEEQLCLYPPDFFAFSVGTNDANVPASAFDPQQYKTNLEQMILKVLRCNPDCAILLTVPNDAYYQKKYPNPNLGKLREMVIQLAEKYKVAVWDFYGIMGETGSSKTWLTNGLMQADLVHFSGMGYQIKGQLYFDAFLKFLEQMRNTEKMK
jgi:lysophospholipase L1-like esterase